ncbi:MAG: hypothetical protein ABFS43_05215 [Thermodesulfobacteriota bacterium]
MEKKLSKLQKAILIQAYQNRIGKPSWLTLEPADISNREVLHRVYGFSVQKFDQKLIFDRQEIGFNRYRAASVATAKCFNRLVNRGLAVRHYLHEIALTAEWIEISKRLISGHHKKGHDR